MESVGPFTMTARLGEGAMGEVWLARDDAGQQVAVKVLTARLAQRPTPRQAFLREAEAVGRADHPAVIRLFDVGVRADGSPWMAMELANGGTLRAHLPRDWSTLRGVLDRLLGGLAHVHARGLLHRDLKPSNVLVCTEGDPRPGPKLADFGIARLVGREAHGGTPRYMAPEQFAGSRRLEGPWTDLYALGCMAFELASGQPPFRGDGRALAEAHAQLPPPRLSPRFPVPAAFEGWLARLLVKDPRHRFRTAAEARAALPGGPVAGDAVHAPTSVPLEATQTAMGPPTSRVPLHVETTHPDVPLADRVHAVLPPRPRHGGNRRVLRGSGTGLLHRGEVPVVGRDDLLDVLWTELREVESSGQRRIVALDGPPGVGVSRLARELLVQACEAGAAGLWVDAAREEPLRAALVDALVADGLEGDALAAHLRERMGADELAGVLDPHRPAGPAVVAGAARAWSEGRLLVLVIDDVGRQPDSLRALPALADVPALILLASSGDASDALEVDVALEVEPLALPDAGALVEASVGVSRKAAGRLAELGGGLPGWTLQLVEAALQQRALVPGPLGLDLVEFSPPQPAEAWSARVDALYEAHPELSSTVEVAAALGLRVDRAKWHALCGERALEAEQVLVDRGLVFARPQAMWWAHSGAIDAVRLRAGAAWGEAHRRCLDQASTPEAEARHHLGAGEVDAALEPLLRAAHAAHLRAEYTRAQHLYAEWNAQMAGSGAAEDDPRYAPAWTREAITMRAIGDYPRALALGTKVVELGVRRSDPDIEADGLATVAMMNAYMGDVALGLRQVERAQSLARAERLALRVHVIAAGIHVWNGDPDAAEASLDRAEQGDVPRHHLGDIVRTRSSVAMLRGDLDTMESALRESMAICDSIGDRWGANNARADLGTVLYLKGQFEEAATAYREALDTWRALGSLEWTHPAANLGLTLARLGRFEECKEVTDAVEPAAQTLGRGELQRLVHLLRFVLAAAHGQAEAFDEWADRIEASPVAHYADDGADVAAWAEQAWERLGDAPRARRAHAIRSRLAPVT